jgi:hypothetical protein
VNPHGVVVDFWRWRFVWVVGLIWVRAAVERTTDARRLTLAWVMKMQTNEAPYLWRLKSERVRSASASILKQATQAAAGSSK